jgi:hypothetical protein
MDKGIGAIAISYDDASKSISAGKDITINGGNITIENTKNDSYGIYTNYNVTINGGIINVTSQELGIEGYEYLTVNGGTINVNNADYGLYSDDYLTINGGVINVNNANYGLYAYDYSLTITGGEITITDAYYYGIYSVYEAINISGGTVTIANTDYGIYTYEEYSKINISGGTVTIDNAYYGIYTSDSGSDITISGGKVNVNATNYGIYSYHDVTINGGEVTVNATGDPSYGIYAFYSVVISGGKVVANGTSYGIYGYDDITLGYGSFGDYIYASNYDYTSSSGAVNIVNGKSFIYDNGNGSFETVSGDNVDKVAIAGKYLFPVINNINIAANQAPDGNYWTTFYTSPKTYKIDDNENAYAYTASNSGTNLTLHKLGKVIPAGTAVVIVGEDNSISMTASTEDAEEPDALTDNDLKGVDVRTEKSTLGTGTFYVLSKKNTDFGFFQYTADYMPANKAYLLLNSNAPSLTMVFEETTGIASMPDVRSKKSDVWYTLDGRKLDEKPTAKGLYIVNGRKVVIK